MTSDIQSDIAAIGEIDVVPKILEVICQVTGLGFAAVARVTNERWIACAVRDEIAFGLTPGGELELKTTICDEIRDTHEPVVIDHVAEDPVFKGHHTPLQYGFQSYISVPILHRGEFFGTLCAIDPKPAKLRDTAVLATFELFADLIGRHLDAQKRLAESEAALLDERQTAELREQFIAVLGHDLRNPLAAIEGGARLLMKAPPQERAKTILTQMTAATGPPGVAGCHRGISRRRAAPGDRGPYRPDRADRRRQSPARAAVLQPGRQRFDSWGRADPRRHRRAHGRRDVRAGSRRARPGISARKWRYSLTSGNTLLNCSVSVH